MTTTFCIGVTRDFLKADGTLGFGDIGLDLLDEAPIAENTTELRPDQIRGYDGLLVLAPIVSAETLQGADKLALIARFGVGYDSVDVAACNELGVLLTITPDGVRRPVFETEPVPQDEPVLALTDQTIVAPHGLCWTDECFRLIGRSACRSLIEVASGRLPQYLVNPQATEHPRLKEKLNRYRAIG